MTNLTKYLIQSLKEKQDYNKRRVLNKSYNIDLNDFFKDSGRIEIKGRFVEACRYPLPIPGRVIIKNDMSKYKLIKRYETNKTNS
jgi:hypothetical protein